MADGMKKQMRPIVRGLKPAPLPKFVQESMIRDPKIPGVFKTNVLPFQSTKKVRVSHFENGPFMFYVQLESMDGEYQQLFAKLQKTELRQVRPSSIGMACLVRHDKKILRAAIAKFPQGHSQDFIVNLVDIGHSAVVKLDNIFHIPEEFLSQFTFAVAFSLTGISAGEIKVSEKEIGFYFRQLTENRLVTLKCVPSDGPPICQYCELFLDNNENIVTKLKSWDPQAFRFPKQIKLEHKTVMDVKVSYVESAQEFYVHLQSPAIVAEYDETCDELYDSMMRPTPSHRNPKPGVCCAVLLGDEWYRGLVVGTKNGNVQVKIVDYGIVEEIPEKHVHLLPEKFVEKPPFAYRCCLKGFEGLDVSDNISTQFDFFCGDGRGERKIFKMTIDSFNDSYLVELEDFSVTPQVNVNKMLLKNSRPLIETIQLENARKRQKEDRGSSSQRGRGNHTNKGVQRQQSPRAYIKKNDDSSTIPGTYYKSQKEASVWGSKESTPSDQHNRSSDWDAPKNISREQNSNANWNDESKKQKKKQAGDLKSGWVSTLLSINAAFCHYDEHIEGLEKILDEMFAFYENKNSRSHLKDISIGANCASRSSDGNWYRSRVESINGDKIKVFHREYGNSEVLHKSKLRELNEKFAAVKDLVVPAYFALKPANESDGKTLFNEMMKVFEEGSKEFSFKICSRFRDGWILEPIDPTNKKNVIEDLVKTKKAVKVSDSELMKILEENEKIKEVKKERKSPEKPKKTAEIKEIKKEIKQEDVKPKVTPKIEVKKEERESPQKSKRKTPEKTSPQPSKNPSRVSVKMTAMTSPTDFYISRADDAGKFAKLHADIQIIATGAAPLDDFEESTLCLALQPFDNHWYRAKIIDSDDDGQMITVRCLDDGKTFSVDDKKLLKIMPGALEQKKFFGVPCSLLVKIERKCEEPATEVMMQLMESELQVEFVCKGEKNFVEVFKGEENIADTLVEKKLASRLEVLEPGKGYTSHINSTLSFYLQFESDQLKLDVIAQYFEEAQGDFAAVEDCKPGDVVAALFPEDECWYRTKIEEVDGKTFSVMFLDYGNVCSVEKIGKISEPAIIDLQKMSKHCSLAKPPGIKRFSETAEKKFEEICAGGAAILDVKMVKPGDPTEVELFLDGKNVAEELVEFCEPIDSILDKTLESNDSGMDNLMSNE